MICLINKLNSMFHNLHVVPISRNVYFYQSYLNRVNLLCIQHDRLMRIKWRILRLSFWFVSICGLAFASDPNLNERDRVLYYDFIYCLYGSEGINYTLTIMALATYYCVNRFHLYPAWSNNRLLSDIMLRSKSDFFHFSSKKAKHNFCNTTGRNLLTTFNTLNILHTYLLAVSFVNISIQLCYKFYHFFLKPVTISVEIKCLFIVVHL